MKPRRAQIQSQRQKTIEEKSDATLDGKRIAILVANGFEQVELTEPKTALERAGAQALIVSPEEKRVKAWAKSDWGDSFRVDLALHDANPDDFDALLLPGGLMSPDKLRINLDAVQFVKAFFHSDKPIAAICHGPWMLIEADAVLGRMLTSFPSIKTDLINAGADWMDERVVVDNGLVTSRRPADIPAFIRKMIEEFAEGVHPASDGLSTGALVNAVDY